MMFVVLACPDVVEELVVVALFVADVVEETKPSDAREVVEAVSEALSAPLLPAKSKNSHTPPKSTIKTTITTAMTLPMYKL